MGSPLDLYMLRNVDGITCTYQAQRDKDRRLNNLNEIACLLLHLLRCIKGLIRTVLNL